MNFTRVLNPGFIHPSWYRSGRGVRVFVKVDYRDGRLSFTGVEGPTRSGNAVGSCGQIDLTAIDRLEKGWTQEMLRQLIAVWKRWHLNDMRAGCEHQRAEKWDELPIDPSKPLSSYGVHAPGESPSWNMLVWLPYIADPLKAARAKIKGRPNGLLGKPCPACGYAYGSAWLREDVPDEVLEWLKSLPETTVKPAWV